MFIGLFIYIYIYIYIERERERKITYIHIYIRDVRRDAARGDGVQRLPGEHGDLERPLGDDAVLRDLGVADEPIYIYIYIYVIIYIYICYRFI